MVEIPVVQDMEFSNLGIEYFSAMESPRSFDTRPKDRELGEG